MESLNPLVMHEDVCDYSVLPNIEGWGPIAHAQGLIPRKDICGSTPCEMVSHLPEAAGISQVHNDSGFLSGRRGSMTRFMDISTHSESSSSHNPLG